jgi:HSP20 family protein
MMRLHEYHQDTTDIAILVEMNRMVEKSHTAGWWPSLYEPLRGVGEKIADWFAPRSEASAGESSYDITMELPGVSGDDINVSVHDGNLTIKGEKRFEREEKGRTYFFSEREYGAFERSFRLPADAQADHITADFKDGVLVVTVPKVGPPPDRSKRIKIRT